MRQTARLEIPSAGSHDPISGTSPVPITWSESVMSDGGGVQVNFLGAPAKCMPPEGMQFPWERLCGFHGFRRDLWLRKLP